MGREIDLMRLYPQSKGRMGERSDITDLDRDVSKRFGYEYFDGDRKHGYGGFVYDPRFWEPTVELMASHYQLSPEASILDIGCAKGFMLVDFKNLLPAAVVRGVDVSEYAISVAHPDVAEYLTVADARELPYDDDSFDLVVSINTLHNLDLDGVKRSICEIERVTRKNSFIMIDGWSTDAEREAMQKWVLTAQTMLHRDAWIDLLTESGYTGDYAFWTVS